NVDSAELRAALPEALELRTPDGARIGMIHDAGPSTRRLERMRRRFPEADAVVFGHSHIPLHEEHDGFQIFNPGSPTDRRLELRLAELEPNEELERDGYRIAAFNVRHRVQAYGYALVEDERPGRFDEQAATRLGVRPGPDFGRLQQGETVTAAGGEEVRPEQV